MNLLYEPKHWNLYVLAWIIRRSKDEQRYTKLPTPGSGTTPCFFCLQGAPQSNAKQASANKTAAKNKMVKRFPTPNPLQPSPPSLELHVLWREATPSTNLQVVSFQVYFLSLVTVVLDIACDSTRSTAGHFKSGSPLCSTENKRLVYSWQRQQVATSSSMNQTELAGNQTQKELK